MSAPVGMVQAPRVGTSYEKITVPGQAASLGLGGPGGYELDPAWYEGKPWANQVAWTAQPEPPEQWLVDHVIGFNEAGEVEWRFAFTRRWMYPGDTIAFKLMV